MTGSGGNLFTTWKPLAAEPFGNPEAVWYPAVQVDAKIADLTRRLEEARALIREGVERWYGPTVAGMNIDKWRSWFTRLKTLLDEKSDPEERCGYTDYRGHVCGATRTEHEVSTHLFQSPPVASPDPGDDSDQAVTGFPTTCPKCGATVTRHGKCPGECGYSY